jgi:hypothetical protein
LLSCAMRPPDTASFSHHAEEHPSSPEYPICSLDRFGTHFVFLI